SSAKLVDEARRSIAATSRLALLSVGCACAAEAPSAPSAKASANDKAAGQRTRHHLPSPAGAVSTQSLSKYLTATLNRPSPYAPASARSVSGQAAGCVPSL